MSSSSDSGYVDNWQGQRTLAECNHHMLTSEDSCDVSFCVGEKKEVVKAHRYVLISRSCVFHAMLCGPLAERDDIKIPDVSKDLFADFLKYLYTDDCSLTPDNVTGLLYLSKKYAVGTLEHKCLMFLKTSLTAENACVIMEQAHLFDEKNLCEEALKVIVNKAEICLKTAGFKDMCHTCFEKILKSDDLNAEPDVVFNAALSWAAAECSRQGREVCSESQRLVLGESVYQICFTRFDAKNFVKVVVPSRILTETECLTIVSYFICPDSEVAPFKKVKQEPKVHAINLYNKATLIKPQTEALFRRNYFKDSITVTSNCNLFLHGIALYGSDARYKISVKCGHSYSLEEEAFVTHKVSTEDACKVDLQKYSIFLEKGVKLQVTVSHNSGDAPCKTGDDLPSSVEYGNYTLTLKRAIFGSYTAGMIAQLIISDSAPEATDHNSDTKGN